MTDPRTTAASAVSLISMLKNPKMVTPPPVGQI
jgi:hypothetical protein